MLSPATARMQPARAAPGRTDPPLHGAPEQQPCASARRLSLPQSFVVSLRRPHATSRAMSSQELRA
eukprot:1523192-Alexandrium_andersonii.AAC.1